MPPPTLSWTSTLLTSSLPEPIAMPPSLPEMSPRPVVEVTVHGPFERQRTADSSSVERMAVHVERALPVDRDGRLRRARDSPEPQSASVVHATPV